MDMIERVARAMYWDRVNPCGDVATLSVAIVPWENLAEEHRYGIQIWRCKSFWREAARAAIEAMREPTDAMWKAPCISGAEVGGVLPTGEESESIWRAMIDAALQSASNQSPPLENA